MYSLADHKVPGSISHSAGDFFPDRPAPGSTQPKKLVPGVSLVNTKTARAGAGSLTSSAVVAWKYESTNASRSYGSMYIL